MPNVPAPAKKPVAPTPIPPKSSVHPVLIVIGVVAALLIGAVVITIMFITPTKVTTNTTNTTPVNRAINQNTNTSANANVAVNENTNAPVNANVPITTTPGKDVTWQTPVSVASFSLLGAGEYGYNYEESATYSKVGTITTGTYAGADLYLVRYQPEGPSQVSTLRVVKKGSTTTILTLQSGYIDNEASLRSRGIVFDTTTLLRDLQFPTTITAPNGARLQLDPAVDQPFTTTGLKTAFVNDEWGQFYMDDPAYVPPDETARAAVKNGFYVQAPDKTLRTYFLVPEFMTDNHPNVVWSDSKQNYSDYTYAFLTGCGAADYALVVPDSTVTSSDLVRTGTTKTGDPVYALKNSNHTILKSIYDNEYQPINGGTKQTYAEFLANHPVFFWVDPFGRRIQFKNDAYKIMAECGKPVIYLYPTTTSDVSVKLDPRGGFSYTEPDYDQGWFVRATPDGTLTNHADGQTYPYLFWEGRGGIYETPKAGFLVAQQDVHTFLVDSLAKLGLNAQETADFIEFWEPRMQGSPYYRVSFMGRPVMDMLAPLTVTPKPDTIIRILMDYEPLAAPVDIPPQTLRAPAREGFTVVEWGGVIR